MHFTRVLSSANVGDLAHITLAKAGNVSLNGGHAGKGPETQGQLTGDGLTEARTKAANISLLSPGKGSGDTLTAGTNELSLTGSLIDGSALGDQGYRPLGLTETTFFGGATGTLQLHPAFDLSGAELLATADVRMEYGTGTGESFDVAEGRSGSENSGLGGDAIGADSYKTTYQVTPLIAPGVGSSEEFKFNEATAAKINMKPNTGRAFLFSVPTKWLAVAGVHRHVKDSSLGRLVTRGTTWNGYDPPGVQAGETDTEVLAWIREDVARGLGLITPQNHPRSCPGSGTTRPRGGTRGRRTTTRTGTRTAR